MFWFYMCISILAYLSGDVFSKLYAETSTGTNLLALCVSYAVSTLFWVMCLKSSQAYLSSSGSIWSICSVLGTMGLGIVAFNERVSLTNACGMILALVAIVLICR